MRSIYDNVSVGGFVALFSTTAAVIQTGASVDTKGYNSAALRVFIGTTGTGLTTLAGSSLTAVLQESADNSTFTTALDNTGAAIGFTGTQATTTAVIAAARIAGLGLQRLRYLRVRLTANQGTSGVIANAFTSVAVIELGNAYNNPVPLTPGGTMPPATSNT